MILVLLLLLHQVNLSKLERWNECRPLAQHVADAGAHYTRQLAKQAARVLGTVDFLGNPLGLLNEVSAGLAELVTGGDLSTFAKSLTHGLSDSAAKVTSAISTAIADDEHAIVSARPSCSCLVSCFVFAWLHLT